MRFTYNKAESGDVSALKKLWLRCFDDIPEAVELFFERNKDYLHGYTAKDGEKIAAAVYLIDSELNGSKAHYLCGAATLPEYRKRGIMSALIEYALNDARQRGDHFSLLFPANEGLYGFYSKLGYSENCFACSVTLSREQLERDSARIENPVGEPDFELLQKACFKDDFLFQNNNFVCFACEYYSLYGVKAVFSENALAFFEEENGEATVFYSIYNDIKELKSLLLSNSDAESFTMIGKKDGELFYNSNSEKYGMARALASEPLPDEIYIGITLN